MKQEAVQPSSFPRRRESWLGLDGGVFPCLWLMVFAKIPACAGMTKVRPCGFSDCLCFQAASKVIRHPRCAFHAVVRRSGIDTRRFLNLPAFASRASMPDLPRIPPQSSVQAGAARGRRRVCRPRQRTRFALFQGRLKMSERIFRRPLCFGLAAQPPSQNRLSHNEPRVSRQAATACVAAPYTLRQSVGRAFMPDVF